MFEVYFTAQLRHVFLTVTNLRELYKGKFNLSHPNNGSEVLSTSNVISVYINNI
jgi:hypothetical protein